MTVKITKPAINVREELADLRKPSGVAGEAMLRAETPQEQFNLIGAGRRNLLINGDFSVSQRGDFTTASSSVNGAYFVDRWFTDKGNVAFNKEQTTGIDLDGTPAISKGVKLTATASGTSYMGIRQKIENPTQYVGRIFTYSGFVKSNSPKARLASFISGTSQTVLGNTHSGNGQWEKLSVTFTITGNPSTAWYADAFIISDTFDVTPISSGDYIEVTMLQLEVGKVATPFEHRSYGEELALCQRYYEVLYADSEAAANVSAFTTTAAYGHMKMQPKRAAPTMLVSAATTFRVRSAGNNLNLTSIGFDDPTATGNVRVNCTTSGLVAGDSGWLSRTSNGTAYIHADAEL
tara:strand:+ start:797 stop:1843 length:1047 start_codon:yes stop_codon:yes gene_type:complete